jgi:hypothetical protein
LWEANTKKVERMIAVNKEELKYYQKGQMDCHEESTKIKEHIELLKANLIQEKAVLKQKKEYDRIYDEIVKLPTKDASNRYTTIH